MSGDTEALFEKTGLEENETPPNVCRAAELAVLAYITCKSPDPARSMSYALGNVKSEMFAFLDLQHAWEKICRAYDSDSENFSPLAIMRDIDPILRMEVQAAAYSASESAFRGDAEYLRSLHACRVTREKLDEWSALIKAGDLTLKDLSRLQDGYLRDLSKISFSPARKEMWTYAEALEETIRLNETEEEAAIPTGISALDKKIGGLYAGELTVIAARPGMGKTAFAMELAASAAASAADSGQSVLFISLEMTVRQMMNRYISRDTAIETEQYSLAGRPLHYSDLMKRRLSKEEREKAYMLARKNEKPIKIYRPVFNPSVMALEAKIENEAYNLKKNNGSLGLVIVDYLGLIDYSADRRELRHKIGDAAKRLRSLAQKWGFSCLALSQLNRESEKREDKRPSLSDLRESGDLEQDVDNALFPFRPSEYSDDYRKDFCEIIVYKHRSGAKGSVGIQADIASNRFRNNIYYADCKRENVMTPEALDKEESKRSKKRRSEK